MGKIQSFKQFGNQRRRICSQKPSLFCQHSLVKKGQFSYTQATLTFSLTYSVPTQPMYFLICLSLTPIKPSERFLNGTTDNLRQSKARHKMKRNCLEDGFNENKFPNFRYGSSLPRVYFESNLVQQGLVDICLVSVMGERNTKVRSTISHSIHSNNIPHIILVGLGDFLWKITFDLDKLTCCPNAVLNCWRIVSNFCKISGWQR